MSPALLLVCLFRVREPFLHWTSRHVYQPSNHHHPQCIVYYRLLLKCQVIATMHTIFHSHGVPWDIWDIPWTVPRDTMGQPMVSHIIVVFVHNLLLKCQVIVVFEYTTMYNRPPKGTNGGTGHAGHGRNHPRRVGLSFFLVSGADSPPSFLLFWQRSQTSHCSVRDAIIINL